MSQKCTLISTCLSVRKYLTVPQYLLSNFTFRILYSSTRARVRILYSSTKARDRIPYFPTKARVRILYSSTKTFARILYSSARARVRILYFPTKARVRIFTLPQKHLFAYFTLPQNHLLAYFTLPHKHVFAYFSTKVCARIHMSVCPRHQRCKFSAVPYFCRLYLCKPNYRLRFHRKAPHTSTPAHLCRV
jgi:hypothetical protein